MVSNSTTNGSEMRKNYLGKDDYYMGIAVLSSQRSKDPITQADKMSFRYFGLSLNVIRKEGTPFKPLYITNLSLTSTDVSLKDYVNYAFMNVGACIVNEDDRIVGIGYNGMPNGTKDELMPWGKDGESELDKKHLYVCHAEMNAIANKYAADLKNCRIYVSHYPCNECAKLIVQAGITKVIYGNPLPPEKADKPKYKATKKIFEYTKVTFREHKPKKNTINLGETASAQKEENK